MTDPHMPEADRAADGGAVMGDEGQAFRRQAAVAQPLRRLQVAGRTERPIEQAFDPRIGVGRGVSDRDHGIQIQ